MKFALASCGTRGDVEPCAAIGLELLRRGHDVRMGAPPNLLGFLEAAGLSAVAYGPDTSQIPDFFRSSWKVRNPIGPLREASEHVKQIWAEMSAGLMSLAEGADLLLTGVPYQEAAANVAEHYDIPLATWHHLPMRANGHLLPVVPSWLIRSAIRASDWAQWRVMKGAEDAQRQKLGLPKATRPASRRIAERGSLEIQAYDELCFPGLAAEWHGRRPFVGALTMGLATDADEEVASWVAAGTPPIFFGFGSLPVKSPAETVAMISAACGQLGERALIGAAASHFTQLPHLDRVKVIAEVNYATVLPRCRAMVHHGGAGTTAAGMRAGIPMLLLWSTSDQPIWAAMVKRLKVGSARRFSAVTTESLVADLRRILAPQYVTRAREIAARVTEPAISSAAAADLLEDTARRGRFG